MLVVFFFSSRRRHTRYWRDWSSDVCSSDLWPWASWDEEDAGMKRAAAKRAARRPAEAASIVIHDLAQAIAALKGAATAKKPVSLWSAEGAVIYAGAGWFAALERQARAAVPSARASFVLDCGERAD